MSSHSTRTTYIHTLVFSTLVTLFSRSKLAKVKVPTTPLSPFFPLPPELASCATTVTREKGEKEGL